MIYCVGDVHGDMESFVQLLEANGVVDAQGRWDAGPATLVQMGDILDGLARGLPQFASGSRDTDVLAYMYQLRAQARAAGGDVRCLVGNHEIMNLADIFTYVAPADAEGRKAALDDRSADGVTASILGLCEPFIVIERFAFCHAGLVPDMYDTLGPDVARALHRRCESVYAALGRHGLVRDPALTDEAGGVTTTRYYSGFDQDYGEVSAMLDALECDRMFIGHNFTSKRVTTRCRGRVVLVDTGISRAMSADRASEMVVIDEKGRVFALDAGAARPV
jgi:hypothetical protein